MQGRRIAVIVACFPAIWLINVLIHKMYGPLSAQTEAVLLLLQTALNFVLIVLLAIQLWRAWREHQSGRIR